MPLKDHKLQSPTVSEALQTESKRILLIFGLTPNILITFAFHSFVAVTHSY